MPNHTPNLLKLIPRPLFFTPVQASAGSKESHLRRFYQPVIPDRIELHSPVEEYRPRVEFVHHLQKNVLRFSILFRVGPYGGCQTIRRVVHESDGLFIA